MRSVNKVILIGNLTRKPELKTTASGQAIVTFGIATNRQWTTSSSEKRTSAEFHECVAWAKLAEICNTYLKKGMLVYVEGYLKTRSWDMDDGTRRFRTEVVLQDMIILEKRGEEGDYTEVASFSADEDSNSESMESAPAAPAVKAAEPAPAPKPAAPAPAATPAAPVEAAPAPAPSAPAAGELSADLDDDNMF